MRALLRVLTTSSAVLCATAVLAQNDPNNEIMKQIYSRLIDAIQPKRGPFNDSGNPYYFVITQPGIFIDPKLLDNDGKENAEQKRIFSEIIDRIIIPSWVYGPKDQTYHEYFKLIIDSYDYKPLAVDSDKQDRMKVAESRLYTGELDKDNLPIPTKLYSSYLSLQNKYLDALGQGQAWLNKNPGAAQYPPKEAAAIKNALSAWSIAGRKASIEDDLELIRRYNPEGFWAETAIQYGRTGEGLSLHTYYPAVATWLDTKNEWPSISVGWSKTQAHTYSRQTSASGGGSFSLGGFFEVGGGANYDRIKNTQQNEASKLDIKFEYLRVDFRRPWLNRRAFSDRRWRFACGTEPEVRKQIISSGPKPDAGTTVQYPSGEMPLVPTGFLIARNANITGNFQKSFKEYFKETVSGSASYGFGPFRVRGSYNNTIEKTDVVADTADNGFTVGHPQIIGFFVETLPLSPDPLPDLFSPCESKP